MAVGFFGYDPPHLFYQWRKHMINNVQTKIFPHANGSASLKALVSRSQVLLKCISLTENYCLCLRVAVYLDCYTSLNYIVAAPIFKVLQSKLFLTCSRKTSFRTCFFSQYQKIQLFCATVCTNRVFCLQLGCLSVGS